MRALLKRWSLALALGALAEHGRPHDRAGADDSAPAMARPSAQHVVGEHQVRVEAPRAFARLTLKRGFEVAFSKSVGEDPLVLRVARSRAPSEEIAPGFVPIGPMVELSAALDRVEVSFKADQFRVRAGHRLVLAFERDGACSESGGCWQWLPARYERGRCVARSVRTYGRRMQFGSLP